MSYHYPKRFNPTPTQSRHLCRVISAILIPLGLFLLYIGMRDVVRGFRCKSWPAADGIIETSKVVSHRGKNGGTFNAAVSYSYKVGAIILYDTRICFGDYRNSSSIENPLATVNRYPVGKKVKVIYNPTNPGLGVLETGTHSGAWMALSGSILMLAAGGRLLWAAGQTELESHYGW